MKYSEILHENRIKPIYEAFGMACKEFAIDKRKR